MEKRIKPLEEGEKIYALIYMATHWEFAEDVIFKIENRDIPEKEDKIFLRSNPYCAIQETHLFRKKQNAAIAVSQLNSAIKRRGEERKR